MLVVSDGAHTINLNINQPHRQRPQSCLRDACGEVWRGVPLVVAGGWYDVTCCGFDAVKLCDWLWLDAACALLRLNATCCYYKRLIHYADGQTGCGLVWLAVACHRWLVWLGVAR